MYTDAMKVAFRSVRPPVGFRGVDVLDNEFFVSLRLDEKDFATLSDSQKREAIEYVFRAKAALEDQGAVVLVVRKAIGDDK